MRRAITLVVSTIVAVAAIAYLCVMLPQAVTDPQDFRAFYCAGSVVRAGEDPYLAEPLGRCEDRLIAAQGASPLRGLVVPAPLPGYVLPAFAALSALPFGVALGLFSLGILAAYLSAGTVLARLTTCPPWAVAGSIALCGVLVSLTNGQIVPFAFLAICLAAREIARGNETRAALYALGSAIEPHIGIPVLLSLFVCAPRSRRTIAIGSALLAALALATLGIGRCVEYLARVLAAQTRAEVHSSDQYSLTALLHALGSPDGAALAIGDAQYACTIVLAVVCARAISRKIAKREIVVTLPAAFAVFGGPYIHLVQMVVAVPLLLSLTAAPRVRLSATIALLLVAVPWRDVVLNDAPFAATAIVLATVAIARAFLSRNVGLIALACVAMLGLGAAENALLRRHVPVHWNASRALAAREPQALAEAPWRLYEDSVGAYESANVYLTANAPTWFGLLLMVSSSLLLVRSGAVTVRQAQGRRSAENARC
jgi:hypothetical protein